ncbi:hypothetical protein DFJ63DRAFT_316932 [Scheffersomyces coipomensis]|uniref:uncharacterized protein n=1 Tax=Scheffersomyces coipomensis TaxID=1788519 RepID=UPI00315DF5FB
MIDYDDYDEESDYDEDYDEEVILPINHLHISSNQPQPLVSILKSQSSTNKRSSSITSSTSTTSSSSLELSIITSKINSIIEEYFPTLINDEDFIDIKNYVINYLIIFLTKTELTKSGSDSNNNTSNDNINSRILNLFIQKQFKLNLIEKIFEILIEKYESIKIDSLLDYFLDFNSKSSSHNKPNDDDKMGNYFIMGRLLHNPKFYDRYKIIWKLDHLNYKYYDKSYFIDDYFNNLNYNYKYTYHKHDEWELLLNKHQFSMNFDKFFIYYNRDLKAGRIYDDDGLDDDDDNDNDEGDDIDERFGNTSSDENYDYYDYSSSSIGMINSNSSNYHRSSTSSTSSSSSSTSGNSMFSDRRVSEVSTGSSFSSKSLIMNKKALTTTTNTNVATTIPKPKTVEKSLRFNDHIDVLSINRHEPVYYLNCIRI